MTARGDGRDIRITLAEQIAHATGETARNMATAMGRLATSRVATGLPCRRCGETCAYLDRDPRHPGIFRAFTPDGRAGDPLNTSRRANVTVICPHCGHEHRTISGRVALRNVESGDPSSWVPA